MTEKQIYNRLNRFYENYLDDRCTDEWYGSDDVTEWVFYRPSEDKTYRLELDTESKNIWVGSIEGDKPYFTRDMATWRRTVGNGFY